MLHETLQKLPLQASPSHNHRLSTHIGKAPAPPSTVLTTAMAPSNDITKASISSKDSRQVVIDGQAPDKTSSKNNMMTAKKTTKYRKKPQKPSHSSTPNHNLPAIQQVSNPSHAPIDRITKDKAGFTDLPLEILIIISAHLLEDFIESRPKAPEYEDDVDTTDLLEIDLRVRAMSFFAAHQVNHSMRNACRIAFSHRMSMAADTATRRVDSRIRFERRFIRDFDKCQATIVAQEKVILSAFERRRSKRLADKALQRSLERPRPTGLKESRDELTADAERQREEQLAAMDRVLEERIALRVSRSSALRVDDLLRLSFVTAATGELSSTLNQITGGLQSGHPA